MRRIQSSPYEVPRIELQKAREDDSFNSATSLSARLKLNLRLSDRALNEYSRRSKEVTRIIDEEAEASPTIQIPNLPKMLQQIGMINLAPHIEEITNLNQGLEQDNFLIANNLEQSCKEANESILKLENNLIGVLRYHERYFNSNFQEIQTKLVNFEEKLRTFSFSLYETVNSRIAHLEFKLAGIKTFSTSVKHSMTSNNAEYLSLQDKFTNVMVDKRYLTEKLDEGFQLTKYIQNAVRSLTDSKEFFEKVVHVYQSKKSYEVFFEKLQFFEQSIEDIQRHASQANPYKNKIDSLQTENLKLRDEVLRLKGDIQKISVREAVENKSVSDISSISVFNNRYTHIAPDLMKILPYRIMKIFEKFEKKVNNQILKNLQELENKAESMKILVKKAKLDQVSFKKRRLDLENKEKMYLKEINKLSSENSRILNNLEEARGKLKIFCVENDELNNKIEKAFKEIQSKNTEKSSILSQNNELKLKLSQCENEVKQLKKTNEKVFYEYERMIAENEQNLSKKQENSIVQQTLENQVKDQQFILAKLNTANEDLKKKLEVSERDSKVYQSSLENFEGKIKEMEFLLKSSKKDEQKKTEEFRQIIEKQKLELENTESMKKDFEVQIWNLEQKRLELAGRIREMRKENEKIREELNTEKNRESRPEQVLSKAKSDEYTKEIEKLGKKNEKSLRKLAKYKENLKAKDSLNEELSGVVEKCLTEIESLQLKLKISKKQSSRFKKGLVSIMINLRSIQKFIKSQVQEMLTEFLADFSDKVTQWKALKSGRPSEFSMFSPRNKERSKANSRLREKPEI